MSERSENGSSTRGGAGAGQDLTVALIRRAARGVPPPLSGRLEEEWLADLAARQGAWSRLRFGLGCCWASRVITRDHASAAVAATVAAGLASDGLWSDVQPMFQRLSRRAIAMGLVGCLHLAALYAFVFGLTPPAVTNPPPPLVNQPLPPVATRELPRLPPPVVQRVTIDRRAFDPTPPLEPVSDEDQMREPDLRGPGPPNVTDMQPPPHEVSSVVGGPGAGFPNADDYYPTLARFKGEEGLAILRVCVDANGRLTSAPITLASTGSPRLDEGAVKLARAGSSHYRPSTEDGRPVSACYPLRIRFQIRN